MKKTILPVGRISFDPSDINLNWPRSSSGSNIYTEECDRGPEFDMYIIIEFNEEEDTMDVIYPRIKPITYHELEQTFVIGFIFGQDRTLKKEWDRQIVCKCPPPSQGSSFYCSCGADERAKESYMKSFTPVQSDYKYYVHRRPIRHDDDIVCQRVINTNNSGLIEMEKPLVCDGLFEQYHHGLLTKGALK